MDAGLIHSNFIHISPELVVTFRAYWKVLVPSGNWSEQIALPFRHLTYEKFWYLVKDGETVSPRSLGTNDSLRHLTANVDGACLDPELWTLLQEPTARAALRQELLAVYFDRHSSDGVVQQPPQLLERVVERLIGQADANFKPVVRPSKQDEDGQFIRHSLFPKVVCRIYDNSCCVCGEDARLSNSSLLVQGAHILPFREFHNDDPRNGLALCPNHHIGFDRGWFGVDEDYRIRRSKGLCSSTIYVEDKGKLRLPSDPRLVPDRGALQWHFANRFQHGDAPPDLNFTFS